MMPATIGQPDSMTCDDAASVYRLAALTAVNMARTELDRIARQTDTPDWRDVEAADQLDAVHTLLARSVSP